MAAHSPSHSLPLAPLPAAFPSRPAAVPGRLPAARLVVLVPDLPLDEAVLAGQVAGLAQPRALSVLYLGLARDASSEAALRRRLATLAALTRTDEQLVATRLSTAHHWLAAVRAAHQPGDELVCLAGQSAWGWGRRRPLAVALAAALRLVVHELDAAALVPAAVPPRAAWVTALGFVGLILVFLWFQIQALRLPAGPLQSAFLLAFILAEFALIAGWDRLNR